MVEQYLMAYTNEPMRFLGASSLMTLPAGLD